MITKYKVYNSDCGYYGEPNDEEMSDWLDNLKEAYNIGMEYSDGIKEPNGYVSGDWVIMSRTIDENSFTVTDTRVLFYDYSVMRGEEYYWENVRIKAYTEDLENAKKIKAKTERGQAIKEQKIIKYSEELKKAIKRLEDKKEEDLKQKKATLKKIKQLLG